ncbi:MAG: acetyltransferase [Burkholderiales bacterium]|nr:acetyltransferase [Burkholderiales bacterium]
MIATKKLLIVGAGGHGHCVAEVASESGVFEVIGFLDDAFTTQKTAHAYPLIGKVADFKKCLGKFDSIFVAIGNNVLRERLSSEFIKNDLTIENIIHPSAVVSSQAKMGWGCVVFAGAVIGVRAALGNGVIVNSGAVIEHDASIHDFGHMGINTSLASASVLGHGAWMQPGSILGHGSHLPAGAVLSPGAVHGS